MHGAALLSMAIPTAREAPWQSQTSTPPARGLPFPGIGERRVCSTCSRLLVEPRRDPASMCTQVLATGSSALFRPFRLGGQAFATRVVAARPIAARHCEGWRVAGAGRVVKRARRAGKGGMGGAGAGRVSPQRAAARCLYESSSQTPSARDETQVRKQGEARTISKENAQPRLYTVPPHSLFAILMNLNKRRTPKEKHTPKKCKRSDHARRALGLSLSSRGCRAA